MGNGHFICLDEPNMGVLVDLTLLVLDLLLLIK